MAGKGAVAARERARLAKVKRYADQAKREQRIEDTVTEFYLAADAYEAALAAMTTARAAMAAHVETLIGDLKEPVAGVAVLCDLTAAQVRALRKEATTAGADTATVDTETSPGQELDSSETTTPDEPEPGGSQIEDGAAGERDGDETGAGSEQKRAS
ncbi:MAG: hypothetical protein L0H96_20840 [Humibacillus sp.]|nr:hypothetical protein [Humibacillus sp.]MDN5779344.1 hypothetical protein [Humibacillus sp.]